MADSNHKIINADCMDAMADMGDNSVHAVVTDPPYGMAFMSGVNEWDSFDSPRDYQEWCEQWATEALRVLKPGGHLIAFSGSRTYGRLMCGVQDAGLEVRDTITWHYGTGFGAGKTQDVTNWMDDEKDIEEWSGFKMGLKPATEFAVLARKPLDGSTYENVLEYGTGALNVDGTRIPTDDELTGGAHTEQQNRSELPGDERGDAGQGMFSPEKHTPVDPEDNGRYPANVCLDPLAAQLLDRQSGTTTDGSGPTLNKDVNDMDPEDLGTHSGYKRPNKSAYTHRNDDAVRSYGDSGGASRFFYTAKASPNERSINGKIENDHSTVKPLDLMEWLVTLVTAPGQTVLDPFAGSGTTIMACRRLNREGIGIEQDEEHADLARQRVDLAHELETEWDNSPEETTDEPGEDNRSNEEGQQGLDVFTDGGESDQSK